MCTAINFNAYNHYFGRNLDLEKRYDEKIVITPRNYILKYKSGEIERRHYAFIGTGLVVNDYPLYYDATNEHGLSIAGLNFVGNAYLEKKTQEGSVNLAPYELIPYILGKCRDVNESIDMINKIRLVDIRFTDEMINSELHWLISDSKDSITLEYMSDGVKIYSNPVGVLTNNPPFEYQMMNLNNFMSLSTLPIKNNFCKDLHLNNYSKGMGAIGLPGDNSSMSRFVRCAFNKLNSVIPNTENDSVAQFFHILASVFQVAGSVKIQDKYERTQYSSCCNTSKGIYYYKTYNNSQITAVNMHHENLESNEIISYDMLFEENIRYMN